eukprot:CAMPEP_0185033556 /NCGR_PEP_ID=MMETSP1103-20130426/22598_1 /TAXON_ID=36769 /ORGANISM="Paraphysomonas bandaiensis, Strain Caron Lab Isolate" /LENGTH=1323 /DNA_ID=CAMNT_0027569865 /DNA_START=14 /DNA_END=3985 /DNA_ORIENTATION=-
MTGFKWKKRWVRSDGFVLIQWHSDIKPHEKVKPKHIYRLANCTIREIKTNRPYAFSVTDNDTGDTIIFAATKVTEYDSWLSILSQDPYIEDDENLDESDHMSTEKITDIVLEFFDTHNISKSLYIREIDASIFPRLLHTINVQMAEPEALRVAHALQTSTGSIVYTEFMKWLQQQMDHGELSGVEDDDWEEKEGRGDSDAEKGSLSSADSRGATGGRRRPKKREFGKDEVLRFNSNGSAWRNIPEPALLAGVLDVRRVDVSRTAADVASLRNMTPSVVESAQHLNDEDGGEGVDKNDWNRRYQELCEEVGRIPLNNQLPEHFHSLYSLCALQGSFLNSAASGAQAIVDSYSLPNALKPGQLLEIGSSRPDTERNEDVFLIDGLIYRLLGANCTDRDREPSESRAKFLACSDDIVRKITGNEVRGLFAVQIATCTFGNTSVNTRNLDVTRPSILLTTLVDYCGFRVQVFAPVAIDEMSTLVYGFASAENLFVNANPVLQSILPVLAKEMNLGTTTKQIFTSPVTLNQFQAQDMKKTACEYISRDLQLHVASDNRVYLLNFSGLFPPDLPRPDSNDVLTRSLRPEFVAEYSEGPIACEAVRYDLDSQATNDVVSEAGDSQDEGVNASRSVRPTVLLKPMQPVVHWIRAASSLREELIPDIVMKLDLISTLPTDSYGLTEFLHAHGVNMRYLGDIYTRSRMPHVKEIVLCEAISRSCKVVLNHALGRLARRGRGQTLVAEQRKRSRAENYIEHQGTVLKNKIDTVVDMFNVVFGYGEVTDDFWQNVLPAVVYDKFQLEMPKVDDRNVLVHMPQLFQAMQYHTGCVFRTEKQYEFSSPSSRKPFAVEDVLDLCASYKFCTSFPGVLHSVNTLAESFLAAGMYADAINSLKLRLSMQQVCCRNIRRPSVKMKHEIVVTTYTLALCYYFARKYDSASALARTVLDDGPRDTPTAARMVTLLMCADFAAGKMADAMKHYEVARGIYIYALGPRHPVHCLLFSALADLYFTVKAFAHSKLMNLKAIDFCHRTTGENHALYASHAFKVGALLLREKSFIEAEDIFKSSLKIFKQLCDAGGDYDAEVASCLHGLSIVSSALEDNDAAINYAMKSLALTTSEGKYISPQAVNCLLLLAELHEKNNLYSEAVELYGDAWSIVFAYPGDYDLAPMLLTLSARIASAFLSSQPLHTRMLFDSVAADIHDIKKREWDIACSLVSKSLLSETPVDYMKTLIAGLVEKNNPVLSSSAMLGQSNVIGVPCPDKKWFEHAPQVPTQQLPRSRSLQNTTSHDNQLECEDSIDESTEQISKLKRSGIPLELEAAVVLKLILELI